MVTLFCDIRNFFFFLLVYFKNKERFHTNLNWPLWSAYGTGIIWLHMTNHCHIYQLKLQIKTPFTLRPLTSSVTQESSKKEVFKILVICILYVLNLGNGNGLQSWMKPVCSTVRRPNRGPNPWTSFPTQ